MLDSFCREAGSPRVMDCACELAGLVDSGYRGEMAIIVINTDKREAFHIKRGDRIAQLVIQKVVEATTIQVSELDATSRGSGGFGARVKSREPDS